MQRIMQPNLDVLGLTHGQRRDRPIFSLAHWYDQNGFYLGWGDLGAEDLQRIRDNLRPHEAFVVVDMESSGKILETNEMYRHSIFCSQALLIIYQGAIYWVQRKGAIPQDLKVKVLAPERAYILLKGMSRQSQNPVSAASTENIFVDIRCSLALHMDNPTVQQTLAQRVNDITRLFKTRTQERVLYDVGFQTDKGAFNILIPVQERYLTTQVITAIVHLVTSIEFIEGVTVHAYVDNERVSLVELRSRLEAIQHTSYEGEV